MGVIPSPLLAFWLLGPFLGQGPLQPADDWLLGRQPFSAHVRFGDEGREVHLENGLVRRSWRLQPNAGCYAIDHLPSGRSLLRAVRPEAHLVLDGIGYDVGGLRGQPNHAYLLPEWLDQMRADNSALVYSGHRISDIEARMEWKRVRHHAPDVVWPPRGVHLELDFRMSDQALAGGLATDTALRPLLFEDSFAALDEQWQVHASQVDPRSSFTNEGKAGEIYTPANSAVYAEREISADTRLVQCEIDPGSDRSASWGPGIALVFDARTIKFHLRPGAGGPDDGATGNYGDFGLWDGAREVLDQGRAFGQDRALLSNDHPWRLRMRLEADELLCEASAAKPGAEAHWTTVFRLDHDAGWGSPRKLRVGKMGRSGGGGDSSQPGELVRCRVRSAAAYGGLDPVALEQHVAARRKAGEIVVTVHYQLYDGAPIFSKWIEVTNHSDRVVEIDRATSEILAVVEHANWVEVREGVPLPQPQALHVETDYAFGGFTVPNSSRNSVHWVPDPDYHTQVNWSKQTPCLLRVEPLRGPDLLLGSGATWSSFRTFELVHDSDERERRGLEQRRLYRLLAPWVTENPLILHVVSTDPEVVKQAIDQAAECGFEMLSLSFGSGLNMEDESAANHAKFRDLADYAAQQGIHLGGYSLLASRRIQPDGDNAIHAETGKPGGQTFGYAPALASDWGQNYFRKLYRFFEETGFLQFTHDGSYPGDWDAAARPPLQRGLDDSQWVQWKIITDYYRWLRARGAYVRVPDYYYLAGANECGMGYREVNWSLPRPMQVIHTRQNIYDGTWTKTPSMGWMFVPLTQYHGGGAAATIEPLDQHVDHYRRMMQSNLALGVQAVYRGRRLYDSPRVRQMVQQQVAWFKKYRDILESDVIHGRRADGADLDWMLHVNPRLQDRGMLVVFNPLDHEVHRTLRVPLYYTGLERSARVSAADGETRVLELARDYTISLEVSVPPQGMSWYLVR